MHKKLFFIIALLFVLVLIPSNLYATYVGTNNGVYKFENKLLKLELYNSTTSSWVTLWDYTSDTDNAPAVDLGAGSVSEQMGTFMSGISIPVGLYTQGRVTMAMALTVRGWTLVGGTYYYTNPSVAGFQTSSNGTTVPTNSQCQEITISPPSGSETTTDTQTITGGGLNITAGGTGALSVIIPMEQILTASQETIPGVGTGYMIMPNESMEPTISPQ